MFGVLRAEGRDGGEWWRQGDWLLLLLLVLLLMLLLVVVVLMRWRLHHKSKWLSGRGHGGGVCCSCKGRGAREEGLLDGGPGEEGALVGSIGAISARQHHCRGERVEEMVKWREKLKSNLFTAFGCTFVREISQVLLRSSSHSPSIGCSSLSSSSSRFGVSMSVSSRGWYAKSAA